MLLFVNFRSRLAVNEISPLHATDNTSIPVLVIFEQCEISKCSSHKLDEIEHKAKSETNMHRRRLNFWIVGHASQRLCISSSLTQVIPERSKSSSTPHFRKRELSPAGVNFTHEAKFRTLKESQSGKMLFTDEISMSYMNDSALSVSR